MNTNNKKEYNIYIKYTDGTTETTDIITDDIKWSIDQFIRNRKVINELNVELKEDDKEEESLPR
jgi:hypothetical protein